MVLLKFAFRNIFRHRARSLISLSAIVFGCSALIFITGFFEDMNVLTRESHIQSHIGHLQLYKKGFNQYGRLEPSKYLIENSEQLVTLLKEIPEVRLVSRRLQFFGLLSTGENSVSFVGQGIEPDYEPTLDLTQSHTHRQIAEMTTFGGGLPVVSHGKILNADDQFEAILGEGLAGKLNIKVDSTIILLTNTVGGSTNALDINVKGIFLTGTKDFDDILLRIPLTTAQNLLHTNLVQSVIIKLHKTEDTNLVKKKLEALFKEKNLDLEIKTWPELSDFYQKTVDLLNRFNAILTLVVALVVILGVFNTMNMAVIERTSEIGTIRAMGNKSRDVVALFLYEGLILGIIGGIVGVIVGALIVYIVSLIGIVMPPAPNSTAYWMSRPRIVPSSLITSFLLAIFIGAGAAAYPAYRAAKMVIVSALRYR